MMAGKSGGKKEQHDLQDLLLVEMPIPKKITSKSPKSKAQLSPPDTKASSNSNSGKDVSFNHGKLATEKQSKKASTLSKQAAPSVSSTPEKAQNSFKPRFRKLRINVIELQKLAEPVEVDRLTYKKLHDQAKAAFVQMTYDEIVKIKDSVFMLTKTEPCYYDEVEDTFAISNEYRDAHLEMSKRKDRGKFTHCVCNLYISNGFKYHGGRKCVLSDLYRVIPTLYRQKVDFTVQTAVEMRMLMTNRNLRMAPVDLFENELLLNEELTELDVEKLYELIKKVVNIPEKEKKIKVRRFNDFLLQRGFSKRGRLVISEDFTVDDPSILNRGRGAFERNPDADLNENMDKKNFSYERLSQLKPDAFASILTAFPDVVRGPVLVRDDVYMNIDHVENWFEYITSGLYFDVIRKELGSLYRIKGKKPEYFVLTCFLLCLNFGYCDVVDETNTEFENYLNGFWKKLFGTPFDINSETAEDISCCENTEHVIRVYPMNEEKRFRRAVYVNNSASDGECCYRYMMRSILPNVKIME